MIRINNSSFNQRIQYISILLQRKISVITHFSAMLPTEDFPDKYMNEDDWIDFLEELIGFKLISWREIASLILGHLNPPQVGTQMASKDGFKARYGKGKTWPVVREWLHNQAGTCMDCGTRLELQADHIDPKENFENPADADDVDNMTLRCRRCNVIRRESHVFGGQTNLTTESALMWLLFRYRPRTIKDFTILCRLYGMTMANIRMEEAWAMAFWLQKAGLDYIIDNQDSKHESDVLRWQNGTITRSWPSDKGLPEGYEIIHSGVGYEDILHYVAMIPHPTNESKVFVQAFGRPISIIPFSHYIENQPDALAVKYIPPDRTTDPPIPASFEKLWPDGATLLASAIQTPSETGFIHLIQGNGRALKKLIKKTTVQGFRISELDVNKIDMIKAQFEITKMLS